MSVSRSFAQGLLLASSAALLGLTAGGAHAASLATEGFTTTTTAAPVPTGWTAVNNSEFAGSEAWIKGTATPLGAQAGATTSSITASMNAMAAGQLGTISDWLILPTLAFDNGDMLTFYTRTATLSQFPDRLEVRFSSVGGTDVGTSPTSVGTFSTLLLTVNPTLALGAYPEAWTQYSTTISGLSGTTNGAIAFRYFVTGGGPLGDNSNIIGIDTVTITAVPEPATYLVMGAGLALIALRRQKARQA